jgi:AraC family transcriptional activator of pobA
MLTIDRLPDAGDPVQVVRLAGFETGGDAVREPHRHDYHELIWVRSGGGRHSIDGAEVEVRPGTVTLIGRGQVHVFEEARAVHGAVVRFTDEVVGPEASPSWLLAGRGGHTVPVPPSEAPRLDAVIDALAAEAARPPDARSAALERHLLSTVLLWVERYYDASRMETRAAGDEDVEVLRRFLDVLERDFAAHHDAAHYADALAMPPAALSRALTRATGRSTKELVLDRVMLEAARLLRFTDLTAGEIAHRVGYEDPLYFSRAFKRARGEAPTAFRGLSRGKSMHP